jgi:hypothetical protein
MRFVFRRVAVIGTKIVLKGKCARLSTSSALMTRSAWSTIIVPRAFNASATYVANYRAAETISNAMQVNIARIHRVFAYPDRIVSMMMTVTMKSGVIRVVVSQRAVVTILSAMVRQPVLLVDVSHPSSVAMLATVLSPICSALIMCARCLTGANPMMIAAVP